MSTSVVTLIGNMTRDFEQHSENAPYRTAIAIDNALSKQDRTRETLFKNITIWPNSPAGQFIQKMEEKGSPIKKGSRLVCVGELQGEEYTPKGESRTRIAESVVVSTIRFDSVSKRKDGDDSKPAAKKEAAASTDDSSSDDTPGGTDIMLDL